MEILLPIIGIAWVILNIILFFKVWTACDDIRRIADKYDPEGKRREAEEKEHCEKHPFDALPGMPDE